MVILIDSRATNNFISTSTARKLGLMVAKCKPFGVTLGTGDEIYGEGIRHHVSLWIQGTKFSDDFFVLELGNLDLYWDSIGWKGWGML